jgi:hypothetical protein
MPPSGPLLKLDGWGGGRKNKAQEVCEPQAQNWQSELAN